ncbi:Os08g0378250, partial [Oryza sativa Japonica Group]
MNSSISLCTTIFDFLMATTCRSIIPLYTTPCPPSPTSRVLSKLFVAFSSSSKLMIILSAKYVFRDINCCNSNPWFCVKNLSLIFFILCSLSLLTMKGAAKPRSRSNEP